MVPVDFLWLDTVRDVVTLWPNIALTKGKSRLRQRPTRVQGEVGHSFESPPRHRVRRSPEPVYASRRCRRSHHISGTFLSPTATLVLTNTELKKLLRSVTLAFVLPTSYLSQRAPMMIARRHRNAHSR